LTIYDHIENYLSTRIQILENDYMILDHHIIDIH